jgi:hypothetical protein
MLRINKINLTQPGTDELVQSIGMDYLFARKDFDAVIKKMTSDVAANYPGLEIEIQMKNETDEIPD